MPKWIYVTGTTRRWEHEAIRRANIIGSSLARSGFGLVVRHHGGVDAAAARGFFSELSRHNRGASPLFRQLRNRYRTWQPWSDRPYNAASEYRLNAKDRYATEDALAICDAVIMVGGRSGSLEVARQFMDARKPVFPIPFSGGRSDELFQEILRSWYDNPIPGLTRNQVLRLALPWAVGAGQLVELLRGTLAEQPDIFISYRRDDSGSAVGRLQRDLADYFGTRRIFVDESRIEPSADWQRSIEGALAACRMGLVVIGSRWLGARLSDEMDVLRREVSYLLENKIVLPILVDDAGMPAESDLPASLQRLPSIQARPISNATWDVVMLELIRTIDGVLSRGAS